LEILIPFYNFYIWLKIIKNLCGGLYFIHPIYQCLCDSFDDCRNRKMFSEIRTGCTGFRCNFPFIYLPYLGLLIKKKYIHPDKRPEIKKSAGREWADAIIFAVIAATIIRTFLLEAYTIDSFHGKIFIGWRFFICQQNKLRAEGSDHTFVISICSSHLTIYQEYSIIS